MREVRRGDGELCGFVAEVDGRWCSSTVFGATLATHDTEADARRHVIDAGLATISERWTLVDTSAHTEQIVCIQEASALEVTLALDYYSLPGVPTLTIPVGELMSGRWRLERRS